MTKNLAQLCRKQQKQTKTNKQKQTADCMYMYLSLLDGTKFSTSMVLNSEFQSSNATDRPAALAYGTRGQTKQTADY